MLTETILQKLEDDLNENGGEYSQNQLAARIGINPSLLCRWRQGRGPSSDTLDKAFQYSGLKIVPEKKRSR